VLKRDIKAGQDCAACRCSGCTGCRRKLCSGSADAGADVSRSNLVKARGDARAVPTRYLRAPAGCSINPMRANARFAQSGNRRRQGVVNACSRRRCWSRIILYELARSVMYDRRKAIALIAQ
jgi:hypothetical protein